jgi:hypothetical protein
VLRRQAVEARVQVHRLAGEGVERVVEVPDVREHVRRRLAVGLVELVVAERRCGGGAQAVRHAERAVHGARAAEAEARDLHLVRHPVAEQQRVHGAVPVLCQPREQRVAQLREEERPLVRRVRERRRRQRQAEQPVRGDAAAQRVVLRDLGAVGRAVAVGIRPARVVDHQHARRIEPRVELRADGRRGERQRQRQRESGAEADGGRGPQNRGRSAG